MTPSRGRSPRPFTSPPNEAVTHKLRTVRRHVVDIDLPQVPEGCEEVFELRFHPGFAVEPIEVNQSELSTLIRTLLTVRRDTSPPENIVPIEVVSPRDDLDYPNGPPGVL